MGLKQKRDLLNLKGFIFQGLCLMFAFILEQTFLKVATWVNVASRAIAICRDRNICRIGGFCEYYPPWMRKPCIKSLLKMEIPIKSIKLAFIPKHQIPNSYRSYELC
jgi:hypothetical protein